jgi:Transposase IS116/IS110/IS902 family
MRPSARRRAPASRSGPRSDDAREPPIQSTAQPRGVAQLVEHRSPKPGVAGSSPAAPVAPLLRKPARQAGFRVPEDFSQTPVDSGWLGSIRVVTGVQLGCTVRGYTRRRGRRSAPGLLPARAARRRRRREPVAPPQMARGRGGRAATAGDRACFTSLTGPRPDSSGERRRQGGITKAGNSHARRLLIEAAWHQRSAPRFSVTLERRRTGKSLAVRAQADRSARRLHRRWDALEARGKPRLIVVVAVARELAGHCWALATME